MFVSGRNSTVLHSKHKMGTFVKVPLTSNDKVENGILEVLVAQWLAIVVFEIYEQLQEILLGAIITFLAALADDVEGKVDDNLFVLDYLFVHTGQPLDNGPGTLEETLAHDGVEAVECGSKLDLFFGVDQAAKGLAKGDSIMSVCPCGKKSG